MEEKLLLNETVYLTVHGSRAYGTHRPDSDRDERGFCIISDPRYYYGFQNFEQKDAGWSDKTDRCIFDIRKFFSLALDCNPNIIEILFSDESDLIICKDAGRIARDNRNIFLSKKAAEKFVGYAMSQLHRMEGHYNWRQNPPEKPIDKTFVKETTLEAGSPNPFRVELESHLFTVMPPAQGSISITHFDKNAFKTANKKYGQYLEWIKNRNEARAKLEEAFGYDCYSDDTEFLTSSGWKHYDEITNADELATVFMHRDDTQLLSMEHRADFLGIEYQKYIDRFEGRYTGSMYNLHGHHTNVLVTPNHRMLFREVERVSEKTYNWKLEEASWLPDSFDVMIAPTPVKKNYSNKTLFDQLPIPEAAYLTLMGWYLSDGTAVFKEDETPKAIRISQRPDGKIAWHMSRWHGDHGNVANSSIYEYKRLPNSYYPKEGTERILEVRNPAIALRMIKECNFKENKRIPRWAFTLSKRLQEKLLFGLIGGDGTQRNHKTREESYVYYSKSIKIADDVQELAFLAGWETARWGPYESTDVDGRNILMYQVHLRQKTDQFRRMIRSANIKKIEVKDQKIVCFTVPNGTLVSRRNGCIAIHGNSKHAMHLIRLLRMGKEIIETGEVKVKRPDAPELLDIRNGKFKYHELISNAQQLKDEIEDKVEHSPLPDEPDTKAAEKLLVKLITATVALE